MKKIAQQATEAARKLRNDAGEALRRGQLRKALMGYHALQVLEPHEAQWCVREAEVRVRLGEKAESIAALARAAECYAKGGFLLRGIAVCKRILDLDPKHTATQTQLASLQAAKSLPAPSPHLEASVPSSGPPLAPGMLAEILLEEVVPDQGAPPGVRALALGDELESVALAGSVLPRVPLFGQLEPRAFERLVRAVRAVRVREDGILFREGDVGDSLYVIVEGAFVPCAERPTRRRLAVLEAGDFFGEISLVTDQPRIATLRALVDSTLLALDADAVRNLIREEPGLLVVFLRFLRERLLHRLVMTSPLFRALDPASVQRLTSRFRFLEVEDGAELVAQGTVTRRLSFALCGCFEVSVYDGSQVFPLASLEIGDVFGEMSLLSGEPAMATVTARGRGFVLSLEGDAFDALARTEPGLLEGLRALAAERDLRNEASLRDFAADLRRRVDLP